MAEEQTEEPGAQEHAAPPPKDDKYLEVEREAKRYGWAPREKWRGNPEDYIDAPAFLESAKLHAPVVRRMLDQEKAERQKETAEYQARVADFERRLNAQARMSQRALETQKRALVQQFEEEKRAALAIEDPAQRQHAYDGATRRERDAFQTLVTEEQREQQEAARTPAAPPVIPPEIQAWGARNPWTRYVPPHLMQEAVSIMGEIERADPQHLESSLTDKLDDVTRVMKRRHPSWFPAAIAGTQEREERPAARVSDVEGGAGRTPRSGGNSRARAFKDLPSEAKSEFNNLLQQRYLRPMKGEDEAKARTRLEKEYADTYWTEYGE